MAVEWTKHRFSGGALALDVANTVVLRGDAERTFDRFDDVGEIARFAAAAQIFRADELQGRRLVVDDARAIAKRVLSIRETTDRLFRQSAQAGVVATAHLPNFLRACAEGLESAPEATHSVSFDTALAVSALSLLSGDLVRKIRICRNCGWLFLDRSRNGSRLWCDMTVCGNRSKARRHYERRKAMETANV